MVALLHKVKADDEIVTEAQDVEKAFPDNVAQRDSPVVGVDEEDDGDIPGALLDDNDAQNIDVQQALLDSVADDVAYVSATQDDNIDSKSSDEAEEIVPPPTDACGKNYKF